MCPQCLDSQCSLDMLLQLFKSGGRSVQATGQHRAVRSGQAISASDSKHLQNFPPASHPPEHIPFADRDNISWGLFVCMYGWARPPPTNPAHPISSHRTPNAYQEATVWVRGERPSYRGGAASRSRRWSVALLSPLRWGNTPWWIPGSFWSPNTGV